MASSNYSASNYLSPFKVEDLTDRNAKNWDMNQVRMNQSLNEFMKNIQRTSNRSLTDNLDITNIDEESEQKHQYRIDLTKRDQLEAELSGDSTTAEFKKYLDELKKNYLEKLTFSCPPKLTELKGNKTVNKPVESLTSAGSNSNTRRSLYFDNKLDCLEEDEKPAKKTPFSAFKSDTLVKDENTKLDNINEMVTHYLIFCNFVFNILASKKGIGYLHPQISGC